MNTIYEVCKNNEPISHARLFQHREAAQAYIDDRNLHFITTTMYVANKMNGAIRGANKHAFQDMIKSVAKPPFTLKKRSVNSDWK